MPPRDPTRRPVPITRNAFDEPSAKSLGKPKRSWFWNIGTVSTPVGKVIFFLGIIVIFGALIQFVWQPGGEAGIYLGNDIYLFLNWFLIYSGWSLCILGYAGFRGLVLWKVHFMGNTWRCLRRGTESDNLIFWRTWPLKHRLIAANWLKVEDPPEAGKAIPDKVRVHAWSYGGFRHVFIHYYGVPKKLDADGTPEQRICCDTNRAWVWAIYHKEAQYVLLAQENSSLKRRLLLAQESRGQEFGEALAMAQRISSGS